MVYSEGKISISSNLQQQSYVAAACMFPVPSFLPQTSPCPTPETGTKISSKIYHILVVDIIKQAKREPEILSKLEIPVLDICGNTVVIRKKKMCWLEVLTQ